jgi:hypothetical protein
MTVATTKFFQPSCHLPSLKPKIDFLIPLHIIRHICQGELNRYDTGVDHPWTTSRMKGTSNCSECLVVETGGGGEIMAQTTRSWWNRNDVRKATLCLVLLVTGDITACCE